MDNTLAACRTGGTTRPPKRAASGREGASGTPSGRRLASAPGASAWPEPARNSHGRRRSPPPTRAAFNSSAASYVTTACAPPAPTRATAAVQTARPGPAQPSPFHPILFPPLPAPRKKPQWRHQSGSCCRSDCCVTSAAPWAVSRGRVPPREGREGRGGGLGVRRVTRPEPGAAGYRCGRGGGLSERAGWALVSAAGRSLSPRRPPPPARPPSRQDVVHAASPPQRLAGGPGHPVGGGSSGGHPLRARLGSDVHENGRGFVQHRREGKAETRGRLLRVPSVLCGVRRALTWLLET